MWLSSWKVKEKKSVYYLEFHCDKHIGHLRVLEHNVLSIHNDTPSCCQQDFLLSCSFGFSLNLTCSKRPHPTLPPVVHHWSCYSFLPHSLYFLHRTVIICYYLVCLRVFLFWRRSPIRAWFTVLFILVYLRHKQWFNKDLCNDGRKEGKKICSESW